MLDTDLMREAVDQEIAKTRFSGVVLVEHNGARSISEACGYANRSDLVPNEMGTRFGFASGGKIFTAVSIYQLIEQGILRLGATIGEILDIPLGRIDPAVPYGTKSPSTRCALPRTSCRSFPPRRCASIRETGSSTAIRGSWCWGWSLSR